MPKRGILKSGRRLHFVITKELHENIERLVDLTDMTLSEYCRDAVEHYTELKRRELIHNQLAQTCQILKESSTDYLERWVRRQKRK